MKILLVEDEPIIMQGLNIMISQLTAGFEVVGQASNGLEAIACIEKEVPDLVITDIRMPGMDGIELLHHISSFHPSVLTIVLSGFQDYEYMRKSIHYQSIDYMLKPLQIGEMLETLERARERKRKRKQTKPGRPERPEADMDDYRLHKIQTLVQEKWLDQLCNGEVSLIDKDFVRQLELAAAEGGGLQLGLLYLDCSQRNDFADSLNLVELAATQIIGETCARHKHCRFFMTRQRELAVMAFHAGDGPTSRLFVELHDNLARLLKIPVFIGISEIYDSVEQLEHAYRQAKELSFQRFLMPSGIFGSFADSHLSMGRSANELPSLDELQQAILSGDGQLASERMIGICAELKQGRLSSKDLKDRMHSFTAALWQRIHEWDYDKSGAAAYVHFLKKMDVYPNWDSMVQDLIGIVHKVVSCVNRMQDDNQETIREAKAFIQRNYRSFLSLKEVADHVYLSQTYFSSLFKMKTGKSFVEYLNEIRIEKSKELLRETHTKTYEISEMVGFGSIQHFNKKFRNAVGLTPSEYRKQVVQSSCEPVRVRES